MLVFGRVGGWPRGEDGRRSCLDLKTEIEQGVADAT